MRGYTQFKHCLFCRQSQSVNAVRLPGHYSLNASLSHVGNIAVFLTTAHVLLMYVGQGSQQTTYMRKKLTD